MTTNSHTQLSVQPSLQDVLHPVQLWVGARAAAEVAVERALMQLWCVRPQGAFGCGRCVACSRVVSRQHPLMWCVPDGDIYTREQSAALIEALQFKGSDGDSVMVITRAECLTATSGNALLKVLEEPPQGWRMVLLTERPTQMMMTVRSRCYEWVLAGAAVQSEVATACCALLAEATWQRAAEFDAWLGRQTFSVDELRAIVDGLVVHPALAHVTDLDMCEALHRSITVGVQPKIMLRWLYGEYALRMGQMSRR